MSKRQFKPIVFDHIRGYKTIYRKATGGKLLCFDLITHGHSEYAIATSCFRLTLCLSILTVYLDMASSETSSAVRVLVSFFLTPESGTVSSQPIHKEKFNVPISAENHKDFHTFKTHFTKFTAINEIARGKGLGENPEVNFSRVNKGASGGVETFSIRTQDAWQHEFSSLIDGNGMLQGT